VPSILGALFEHLRHPPVQPLKLHHDLGRAEANSEPIPGLEEGVVDASDEVGGTLVGGALSGVS
jgi:hypothetical protein